MASTTHLGSNGDQHAGTFSTCQPCTQASADALRQCTGSVSTTVTNIDVATGTVESQATSGPSPEVVSAAVRALAEDFRAAGAEVTVHPQHRYNPRTDPARVDEATVRRAVGIGVWMRGVGVILQQGTFVPGGDGLYGAVYVLVKRSGMPEERAYSTHRVIVRSEDGQPLSVSADIGHYDMSRDKAEWDLAGRVG